MEINAEAMPLNDGCPEHFKGAYVEYLAGLN